MSVYPTSGLPGIIYIKGRRFTMSLSQSAPAPPDDRSAHVVAVGDHAVAVVCSSLEVSLVSIINKLKVIKPIADSPRRLGDVFVKLQISIV